MPSNNNNVTVTAPSAPGGGGNPNDSSTYVNDLSGWSWFSPASGPTYTLPVPSAPQFVVGGGVQQKVTNNDFGNFNVPNEKDILGQSRNSVLIDNTVPPPPLPSNTGGGGGNDGQNMNGGTSNLLNRYSPQQLQQMRQFGMNQSTMDQDRGGDVGDTAAAKLYARLHNKALAPSGMQFPAGGAGTVPGGAAF